MPMALKIYTIWEGLNMLYSLNRVPNRNLIQALRDNHSQCLCKLLKLVIVQFFNVYKIIEENIINIYYILG